MQAYDLLNGNVAKAAQALGVSKVTFYAKLKQWGVVVASRGRNATDEAIEREVQRRLDERLRALGGTKLPALGPADDDEHMDPPTPRAPR